MLVIYIWKQYCRVFSSSFKQHVVFDYAAVSVTDLQFFFSIISIIYCTYLLHIIKKSAIIKLPGNRDDF